MASNEGIISDGLAALKLVARLSWRRNLTAWLFVPVGALIILLACFGVDALIGLSSVSFPASVALLVGLFIALILCNLIIGDRRTRALVSVIEVPAGFALRYINIFFTPSFVLLPLSPPISGVEVGKIIAVFLIGFVVVLAIMAWLVRGLQLIFGSSKRAIIERAEEMGNENDAIPLADSSGSGQNSGVALTNIQASPGPASSEPASSEPASSEPASSEPASPGPSSPGPSSAKQASSEAASFAPTDELAHGVARPERAQDPSLIRGTGGPPESQVESQDASRTQPIMLAPVSLTRPQRWAAFINANFDRITYGILFLFVGIPIYYATGYAMPAHLTFNVLAYFAAIALPPRWKQFLHPVLLSSGITILGIWILGLIRGDSLDDVLGVYKTGTNYLTLWHDEKNVPKPGAGDIFGSVLDVSIVALALPMYNYRLELKRHFFAIVAPNVVISVGSLFGYPALCYAIGISSKRSLAFAARSLTLALATPAIKNVHGDLNTVAALAIMSGILGVLIGPRMMKWLRIPEDDYVTRGVTLGGNSSAIATALLLQTDPRAAALSSLSMSVFGIITLALTSVPPIVQAIDSLVDLQM